LKFCYAEFQFTTRKNELTGADE
jgi:hypothetical protein